MDTRRDIGQAANHMRAQMDLAPLGQAEICRYVGWGLQQFVQRCLNTDQIKQVEEGIRVYRSYYTQHLLDHTALYPSALQFLDHFQDRKQVVVTNKPNPYSVQILKSLGVSRYFSEIIAGDSIWPKKPDPKGLLSIMDREEVAVKEAVFIGDSPMDVQTGKRAGVMTVGMTHGFSEPKELQASKPDRLVDGFEELLQMARQERW